MEGVRGKFQNCFYTFSIERIKNGQWQLRTEIHLHSDEKSHISASKYDFSDAIGLTTNSFNSREEAIKAGKNIVEGYLKKKLERTS